jgi:hypothetical protein
MKILAMALATLVLGACALPATGVKSGSVRPTLAVSGAPESAVLYLDGIALGTASQYDGRTKVLNVEEGPHRVEIRMNGVPIHSEKFVISSGETRTISVGGAR